MIMILITILLALLIFKISVTRYTVFVDIYKCQQKCKNDM